MPNIDLSILNQRQTPAFFADTLANRPAAGFVGRIFISTDTLDLYRDTGSAWLLLSPSSTGTITGSGAAGQVTYFSGTSSITGNNNLFWDSVNGHLGIGTNAPGTALQINHGQSQLIRLNQTTATNDTKIAFQNSGVALWRIGNSYNAGANDYAVFDVVSNLERFSIKTTGQTFVGAQTTSSGRLVVNNATGDNHIVVIGATAPSLRINNSGSGATKQIGIGLATATNNFIQGSADRDMAIFNGSTTPSPILFGIYDTTNVQEAARISAARNFLIGTTTDGGQKLQVNGGARTTGYYLDGMTAGAGALYYNVAQNRVTLANYNASGILDFEVNGGTSALTIDNNRISTFKSTGGNGLRVYGGSGTNQWDIYLSGANLRFSDNTGGGTFQVDSTSTFIGTITSSSLIKFDTTSNGYTLQGALSWNDLRGTVLTGKTASIYDLALYSASGGALLVNPTGTNALAFIGGGNFLIGTTTDNGDKLQVSGNLSITGQQKTATSTYTREQITSNAPVSSTTDIFRFLQNNGTLSNGYHAGILYVQGRDNNTGANSFSNVYYLLTTSNGTTDSAFNLIGNVTRGSVIYTSIAIVNDGGGGDVKVQITTNATPTNGVQLSVTYIGIY